MWKKVVLDVPAPITCMGAPCCCVLGFAEHDHVFGRGKTAGKHLDTSQSVALMQAGAQGRIVDNAEDAPAPTELLGLSPLGGWAADLYLICGRQERCFFTVEILFES